MLQKHQITSDRAAFVIILMDGHCLEASQFSEDEEQQRVAVGPGNAQCMSIRQVSLRRGTCGHCSVRSRRC